MVQTGKHNPKFSGEVSDFLWDWMGMYHTFAVFGMVILINGRMFARFCAAPEEWQKIEESGALAALGHGEAFKSVPFYSPAAATTTAAASPPSERA
jgi:hypothetical protein